MDIDRLLELSKLDREYMRSLILELKRRNVIQEKDFYELIFGNRSKITHRNQTYNKVISGYLFKFDVSHNYMLEYNRRYIEYYYLEYLSTFFKQFTDIDFTEEFTSRIEEILACKIPIKTTKSFIDKCSPMKELKISVEPLGIKSMFDVFYNLFHIRENNITIYRVVRNIAQRVSMFSGSIIFPGLDYYTLYEKEVEFCLTTLIEGNHLWISKD